MKKAVILLALTALLTLPSRPVKANDDNRVRPNYALAERFSPTKVYRMVKSTTVNPYWMPDGKRFIYSWTSNKGTEFYIVDAIKGTKEKLWDMENMAKEITLRTKDPYDAQHVSIQLKGVRENRYLRFDVASKLQVPRELPRHERNDSTKIKNNKGKKQDKTFRFEYDIETGELFERTKDEIEDMYPEYPNWANVSPDGKYAVYEKNYNLWYMSREDLEKLRLWDKDTTIVEHQLTFGGTVNRTYSYHPLDEKPDSAKRFYPNLLWSPDSRYFVSTHRADSILSKMWVINSLGTPRPTLKSYYYQMPGEETPVTTMQLFDFENKTKKNIKISQFKQQSVKVYRRPRTYAERHQAPRKNNMWLGDSKGFYFERTSRDLKRMEVCYVNVECDSAVALLREEMNTSIESKQIHFVNNGKNFVHWSERTGWAMLYMYNADGTLKNQLTDGAFHVDEVLAVNDKDKKVYFTAQGYNKEENPYYRHLFSVNYDGTGLKQLDESDMNGKFYAAEHGEAFVAASSRVDTAPVSTLYKKNGKKVMELERADLSLLFEAGYKFPERFKVKAADGITDLYGVMYKPYDFDSTKCYPLIEYVYPGPQTEEVNESWSSGMNRVDRLAQMGFIVITVGNRGGHPNRSKWYHNFGYGNLRDYGLADKKAAAQQLIARHPFIDGERVGIHGHSGGGFMSTAALLTYNDFFKAAVSCAGNHDNRIYNNWWSEKHHGIKENVSEKENILENDTTFSFKISTNQELAKRLKGHLMLVTGDVDDNVHPANTTRVVDALIRANKRFEMLVLPGQAHSFNDMDEYFFWRMADFFSRHLLGEAKEEIDIKEINNDK